jgi:hypothetical protein
LTVGPRKPNRFATLLGRAIEDKLPVLNNPADLLDVLAVVELIRELAYFAVFRLQAHHRELLPGTLAKPSQLQMIDDNDSP